MNTIEELKEHMHKHKDAVVIMGPGAVKSLNLYSPTKEELEISFSRKALRRDVETFWDFYKKKIWFENDACNSTDTYNAVSMLSSSLVSTVVDLNPVGTIMFDNKNSNYIPLHGNVYSFTCQNHKCKTKFAANSVMMDGQLDHTCEVCGKELRPDILLFGESYNEEKFQEVVKALNETHTLITIGVDYTETPIVELIADYGELRDATKEKAIVAIADPSLEIDLNEQVTFHEFLVKDDCDAAIKRLVRGII